MRGVGQRVGGVHHLRFQARLAQARAVIADMPVAAVKLGMLGSVDMVDTVLEVMGQLPGVPLVCDPVLRASDAGRAVFLTTRRVAEPKAYWGAYGATKAGMEHLALTWAQEAAISALRVNLADPGAVATRMRARAYPGEDAATLPKPADVAPAIAALCLPGEMRNGEVIRLGDR